MAVEIPVVVDIDSAFQDAAKRVSTAMKPLQQKLSRNTLKLDLATDIDKKGNVKAMRSVSDLLKSSTVSAKELSIAMEDVRSRMAAMEARGGFNPAKGLKQAEREMLALYSALEVKSRGGTIIDRTAAGIARIGNEAGIAGQKARGAVNSTNAALKAQGGLLGMLTGYLSAYTAVFAGLRLIKNVREVTAEFEMQRVALAGIIQDTTRANQLFAQIKAAAVQSPFEIKDLVSFTKQLSAYRIETDKLFDVTMRLADVSAGLGVDMNRLVLAYGQVRAASVLRGQELRQFTEAGIPLVELLAQKFTKLRGEMVSTGEVFELISDRAVPFAMIEEIFNDMTSAGGIFYEMQLKQSETLKGQWMKLKDVISIAYDEMGRTAMVNNAMSGWIKMISNLVKNWERIASVVNVVVYSYIAYGAAIKGIIPLYNVQQKSIARQIQLEKQQQIEQIKLASRTEQLTKADQRRIAQIKKMTAEDYKRIYAMDKMNQSQAMMFYWRNKDNKEIVKAITQTGILTKAQMTAINKMNRWQLLLKTWGSSLRTFFKTIGSAIASFWPIAAVSALITVITGLVSAHREQEEAVERVDKAYHEQEQSLLTIVNAYRRIQKAISDVADEQKRATMEAESFGKKLDYAQKIVDMLKKYGLGGDFDLSLLNADNIDEFVGNWLDQLNKANELTRDWGRSVAQVANAWEASILGIHFAGDNLKTDIKQLTNAFVKLTSDKQYRQDVKSMQNYLELLEDQAEEEYKLISSALGEEAKLAIAQKRRNESEYEYQMRLVKNYETIRRFAQSDRFILSGAAKSFKSMEGYVTKFETRLDEVEREFDKTWGSMAGKDELTIKMSIDKLFAENQWEDWLKEAWIERVNNKYQMNIQITPTVDKINVPKGMKGILATEFQNLFTEEELGNMNSITEIGKAIEEKMKKAAEAIAEADKMANNLANNEAWSNDTKEKIKKAQITINEELAKEEKDRNRDAINEAIALIDALTNQNTLYDEQIVKKKESAKADYDMAKAAKERLLSENLSDMGRDIKQAFPSLMKDAFREITDENYISRFLISDDDLQKIKDGSDAYDVWAKHMKDIADEREKMLGSGVSEQTVLEEQARLDAERLSIEEQLADINEQIADWSYEAEKARYDSLRLAVQQATTAEERSKAEAALKLFIQQTNIEERAILKVEQQRLQTQLGITNAALGAQNALVDYFSALTDAEKSWADFGKRYNFTLRDKPKGGAGQDPWIMLFKNRMKFMQDFQKGVEDLDKYLAHSASLGREQEIMKGRGLSLGIKTEDLLGTPQELREWYDKAIKEVADKIRSMGGKEFAGLGVTEILAKDLTGRKIQKYQELLAELWKGLTDFDTDQIKQEMDEKLKKLSDDIKRSETARNFFNNILDLTGDEELAATMGVSVYGGIGGDFKERMQQQLNQALGSLDASAMTDELRDAFANQDFATILANLDKFPTEWQDIIKRMASDSEKFTADWVTDIIKTYQKTKTYEERISDVHKKEEQKRKEISESTALTDDQKATYTAASEKKEAEEIADIELEALKNTYEWTQAFKDMERVSTDTLNELIRLLDEYIQKAGDTASPEALRAVTQAREQAQEQLVIRDAYSNAIDGLRRYVAAKKEANKLEKEGKKNTQEYRKAQDQARDALKDAEKAVQEIGNSFNTLSSIVSSVSDILDLDELSDGRAVLQGIASGLTLVGTALVFINAMFTLLETNPVVLAISAIIAGVASLASILSNLSVAKANREIKRQQELIEELEYSYDRLEKAIAKAFGSDYIYNYNKQMENLVAQQAAYEKQAELERGKGKKADAEKIKEYENSARDAADQIAEMSSQLSEFFAGTDLTSAASDFANAWIDAYKEFGSTTDAMKERFNDMIQSMITQSLGAKIMQSILQPLFDQIDEMAATGGELSAKEIADIATMTPEYIEKINGAMSGLMNSLTAAGYNMRQQVGGFTGISRDIAGASEESINGLAAGINTQNFYMSLISQNVAAILAAMTGETVEGATGATVPDPYKDTMLTYVSSLPQMRDDMYAIRSMLERVIRPNGTTATHYVATKM